MLVATSLQVHSQSLVYDQQSATGPKSPTPNDFLNIQTNPPLLQSFTPALSAIGFVQFQFWDIANNGTNGATVSVNLWTGSPNTNSATLLGSTAPVYMPNGFVNNGLGFAGITNFNFSTPITLNSGQAYYLQPVVLSGDNPWDIAIFTTSPYQKGNLFAGGFDTGGAFWFREGIVSVPEPTALVLIGLSGLLVFTIKRLSKLVVLFATGVLFTAAILPVNAEADSIVQITADAAGLAPVDATEIPRIGTFWVMTVGADGQLGGPPYPYLPPKFSALPTYSVKDSIFIVDDTGGQILPPSFGRISSAQAASTAQTQAESLAGLIDLILNPKNSRNGGVRAMASLSPPGDGDGTNGGFQPNGLIPPVYTTNDLYLSITSAINGIAQLVIHPPWNEDVSTDRWNLLYTTNLATPFTNWWWILTTDLGQTNLAVPNATDAQGFYALDLAC